MPEFIYRNFQWDDIQELSDTFNLIMQHDGEEAPLMTPDELRHQLDSPGFDPLNNVFSVFTPDGKLAGNTFLRITSGTGQGNSSLLVHPDYRGQGIEERLLACVEDRLWKITAELPADQPIYLQRFVSDKNTALIHLFEADGYKEVRNFYTMRIDLDTPQSAPEFPAGITLRPVDWERDSHIIHAVQEETFMDHWGHMNMPYDNWVHYFTGRGQDLTLWQIAVEGDEVAGICLNHPWNEVEPGLVWIAVLGVRKPWRKHGLGAALLKQSFYVFQQRGFTEAGLNVDATNTTNAVALYERVGMHVHNRRITYRKLLRGRDEDILE